MAPVLSLQRVQPWRCAGSRARAYETLDTAPWCPRKALDRHEQRNTRAGCNHNSGSSSGANHAPIAFLRPLRSFIRTQQPLLPNDFVYSPLIWQVTNRIAVKFCRQISLCYPFPVSIFFSRHELEHEHTFFYATRLRELLTS